MEIIHSRQIPVSLTDRKPWNCPDQVATSPKNCNGPVSNPACGECPTGISRAENSNEITVIYNCPGDELNGSHDVVKRAKKAEVSGTTICTSHYKVAARIAQSA